MDNSDVKIGKIYTRGFLDGCARYKGNLMVYKKKDIHSLTSNADIKYEVLNIIPNCQVYDYTKEYNKEYHFDSYNNIIIAKELG